MLPLLRQQNKTSCWKGALTRKRRQKARWDHSGGSRNCRQLSTPPPQACPFLTDDLIPRWNAHASPFLSFGVVFTSLAHLHLTTQLPGPDSPCACPDPWPGKGTCPLGGSSAQFTDLGKAACFPFGGEKTSPLDPQSHAQKSFQ